MWLFYNFFQPVMRLVEKRMVNQKNGKQRLRRRHDLARTPYERLCETKTLASKRQQELNALREQTNPRQLRQEIYQMLDTLFSLPTATEDKTEDVYQTLRTVTGTEIEKGCGYVENSPQAPSFPHTHSLYYCHSEGRNTVEKAQGLKNPR